jgi:hypothetical protein
MTDEKRPDAGLLFTLRPPLSEEDVRAYEEACRKMVGQLFAAYTVRADFMPPDFSSLAAAVARVNDDAIRTGATIAAALLGVAEQVREVTRIFGERVAAMPEDEREEWRQAFEDAPPCEVDVNANDSGVM